MKRFLKLLFLVPLVLAGLAVALANRQLVTVSFDPFAHGEKTGLEITAPFFLVFFLSVMLGVVIGGFATWLEQGKYRQAARRARAEVRRLTAEVARRSPPSAEKRKF
ncbi:lipopolysaccharide assembly protein LapA domain-containing protein [Methylocapsa aurea]|jgi:uncharacterized integral membrane protein|uniref:lipopolysaccharide assembly protein LapA domain-containing protein n=1 Tax=Methylocapsa aurea TaxID=663610 RepID=UPI000560E22A|nr:lipopolysaccharide assembly protein LapA domain-containing protein [Methylocapsa aurea]